ncbi:uncharacterized protein LOC131841591 [Achroia grisella]|uniref:uncharacterized protein LOC131841591 n=1 Tax=Achroia grisella TaxID=688607 RepID=UPI0027D339B5|nr:uncharacterized protein LOC131841591 [Achroia grisella]
MQYQIIFCAIIISTANCHLRLGATRNKRDVVGALDIVTNDVQPIHAEVKQERNDNTKPCPTNPIVPSMIESGTVFQVIPPSNVLHIQGSLRKSLPITDTIDLVRSISRGITFFVLIIYAVIEFFPGMQHLISIIWSYLYAQ